LFCSIKHQNYNNNSFPRILALLVTSLYFKKFGFVDQADQLSAAELPHLWPDTDL
jgi:hypothetical protein